ncbi:MAG: M23 family metallopeptidase [Gemmatimonadota bacterium]|nr:M23 family metallopeptidase [Gemmatimonadota bacterium]MDE2872008.1 M23 family metallopeptidase [Gemmatimonadota bacterium]
MARTRYARFSPVAALVGLVACEESDKLRDRLRELTPYEEYQASLAETGLDETALGKDWTRAGLEALNNPTTVALPFQETGHITPERPAAVAYRVKIPRGRKLTFEVSLESGEDTRLFTDLFRVPLDRGDPFRPVLSTDSVFRVFTHEPWRGGEFILRVQPELLRGGNYRVTLREESQLGFPVEGRGMSAILSVFGAARDGGRREHHGVDIFAPRGTPVLAATDGRVRRVRETPRGGKVVWIREPVHEASLYYAHLDSQHVSSGQLVERGDTIGFVGNTGNARTTPPHLHFGLYRRGPIDPWPFLDPPRRELPELTADPAMLGTRVRSANEGIRLRAAPGRGGEIVRELDPGTPLQVLGASGGWFRVRLPDGSDGFVAARLMEAIEVVRGERADHDDQRPHHGRRGIGHTGSIHRNHSDEAGQGHRQGHPQHDRPAVRLPLRAPPVSVTHESRNRRVPDGKRRGEHGDVGTAQAHGRLGGVSRGRVERAPTADQGLCPLDPREAPR